MIGLKRGDVKLLSHRKEWQREFERQKTRILKKLDNVVVDVQHIGSTAVPGIKAKPIIDMVIGVRRLKDANKLVKTLRGLGYKFDRAFQHQKFFVKGLDSRRTHYLHVMRYNGAKWRSDKLFRDYLITHPTRAKAYSRLKMQLAKKYPNERQKYSDNKDGFIKDTIRLAKKVQS
ncbi:hypothetical protein A2765_06590 [Candidatus Kaiserbacteria bacterium RIFCSPHIGHO2_01_FULL_56_24]|uniref:GrpB family protein n=1 Tax=Candidatus Kaiserbacteria bacterium RIFCSPHIGHO2_01_FULL_56_24 TaxID=1798487 RepID=A0A1F6DCH7_9BACT|nr:MAG: hypothetical protein A2765_06590 [Candidatus Kaiserbacteria bacterium RIFCSPHIGHO2_01_FULL_56_24]